MATTLARWVLINNFVLSGKETRCESPDKFANFNFTAAPPPQKKYYRFHSALS